MKEEQTIHAVIRHTQYGNVLAVLAVLLLAAMLPTACTDDGLPHEQTPDLGEAITFCVSTSGDTRAAAGEVGDLAALKGSTGFGVFASYTHQWRYSTTTVSPDFLCNQKVTWDGTNSYWKYDPVKYWPNGEGEGIGTGQSEIAHQVSFFAYAPWSDLKTTGSGHAPANCITDCSQAYEQGDPWVLYRIAGNETDDLDPTPKQVDLLYAVCDYNHYGMGDGLCNIDLTKPEVSQRVSFTFRHALGIVGDKVAVSISSDLQTKLYDQVTDGVTSISLVLKSITIDYTLTSKARLVLFARDGQPNWKTVTSENVKTTRRVSLTGIDHTLYTYDGSTPGGTSYTEAATKPWTDKGVFYIPIEGDDYVQRARITVGYRVERTGGTNYPSSDEDVATITKDVILHEQSAYGPGQRMKFDISLGSSIKLSE